ncbi:hypothetical protein MKX01_017297 [Papaver californicum]|nr:hypothetical protein MKX01_017297 [Papaver californicum]
MAPQITCEPQKIGTSATQNKSKSLRSLGERNYSVVTVRVTRTWEELDFMCTNDVTIIDYMIVDKHGDELDVVIPKNLIWKFDKKIREGCLYSIDKLHLATSNPKYRPAYNEKRGFFRWNTTFTTLDVYSVSIVPHKFHFSEFESLESNIDNIQLTAIVQSVQMSDGQPSRIREITVENVRYTNIFHLANQVGNEPIDCDSVPCPVLVAVCSTFYNPPYYSSGKKMLPNIPFLELENQENISQLLTAKWDLSCQFSLIPLHPFFDANVIFCTVVATDVLMDRGWHYLAYPRCSKKVLGEDDELLCTKYEGKVEMPIAW